MRLIDADMLLDNLDQTRTRCMTVYGNLAGAVSGVMKTIDTFPTVDAVPVVRCRDCKHMAIQSNARFCTVWNGINGMGDDGFCNYGERKEGVE